MFSHRAMGLAVVCSTLLLGTLQAQDFRIETKTFSGDNKDPVSQNLTLFADGKVYDFLLTTPEEITVLDPQRSQFILLDVSRKTRTTLSKEHLAEFTAGLKARAGKSKNPLIAFCASPKFDVQEIEDTNDLNFKSKVISYRVTSEKSRDAAAARSYRRFADWYARLNATRPGAKPPHARLFINNELGHRGLIPRKVELTIPARGLLGREVKMHSEHVVSMRILSKDRNKIEKVGDYLATFEAVSIGEFRQIEGLSETEK
jgi:hypothetical protein